MTKFKEGDLVRVKCGGPEMSVVCIVEDYKFDHMRETGVFCVYEKDHLLFEQAYPSRALDLLLYERRFLPR
jgi:uncharacterized protein YodC (DUF2158 family)